MPRGERNPGEVLCAFDPADSHAGKGPGKGQHGGGMGVRGLARAQGIVGAVDDFARIANQHDVSKPERPGLP